MSVYEFALYLDAHDSEPVLVVRDILDYHPSKVAEQMRRTGVTVGEDEWVPGERIQRVRWTKRPTP